MYDPEDVDIPESAIRKTFGEKPWVHKVQRHPSCLDAIPLEDWRRIIAAYMGYVTFIDEVGRLLDALEELGAADDTLVVFSSDHGGFVTGHKMHDKGPAMYEDIYNVPFIVNGPGFDGEAEDAFVSLLDLAPTFCEAAGVEIPDAYVGRSLFDLFRDDTDWREDVVAEFHGHKSLTNSECSARSPTNSSSTSSTLQSCMT
jgi:arylsulfatase A-like enzyme